MVDDNCRRPADAAPHSLGRELIERTVHDLKNPLAVVRATLEWLETELVDRAEALDAVHDATTAAGRLMAIVEDLDVLAHLESGRNVARRRVDLAAASRAASASAGARLASRRITVNAAAAGKVQAAGEEPLLTRAIEALVELCARGASSGACIDVAARLVAGGGPASAEGAVIEITIGVRGTVPTEAPSASFEALSSGGLGAYLALRVVEAHGGSLLVVPTATVPRVLARLPPY
jgi:two-component system OmpR family sensor kinase